MMNEEEMEKHFDRQITKNVPTSLQEMVNWVMKTLMNHKFTVPGNFQRHSGAWCITCSYKARSRLLYLLEWGCIQAYKPPMHICSHKISFVNWTCDLTSCSFNLDIETKQGTQYTVRSIKRQMSGKLILLMQNVQHQKWNIEREAKSKLQYIGL